MTVYRAGSSQSQYVSRCEYDLRCICYARGDRNAFVDETGPYCIIIDREYNKIELEDVGVNSSTIEAVWLEADYIPIERSSIIKSEGHTYKAKGSPANHHDGWMSVQLQKTCRC